MRCLATVLILALATLSFAADPHHADAPHTTSDAQPTLSTSTNWVPILLMVIGGMFVAAATIGPIVHANAPEEVPPMHAHDEPPGSSHHHGASGTVNPEPDAHGHGHH